MAADRFRESPPPAGLADVVDAFWVSVGAAGGGVVAVPPDGCVDLIAAYPDSTGRRVVSVVGPTDRPHPVDASVPGTCVGVRFRPGMAAAVLGVRPADLFRREVDLGDCGPALGELVRRLTDADPADAGAVLRRELAERAARVVPPRRVRRAVELFARSAGGLAVAAVAADLGVTERTLHRDFVAAVGLPPKVFARIARFRAAARRLRADPAADLTAVALAGGFADQAHMTREFRALAGRTPGSFAT